MAEDMNIFAKFSASGYENPKLMALALNYPTAYRVWTWAIMYAVRSMYSGSDMPDGFVPEIIARNTLVAKKKDLTVLEDMGFFEPVDGGWMIHDFLDAQGRSSSDVEESRKRRAEAGRLGGKASGKARAKKSGSNPEASPKQTGSNGEANASASVPEATKQTGSKTEADIEIDKDIFISPPTPSSAERPDVDRIVSEIGGFYPSNRWDGTASRTRLDLEVQWPKIVKAAGDSPDAAAWFIERTRAYVQATEARFVKKFSRYLGAEDYATPWKPQPVEQPQSRQMANREHNFRVAVSLMTPEERRRHGLPEGDES